MRLSVQLSSLFLPNLTQDSTQLLSSKYIWLLIGRIRFSLKCWRDQFVCLRRERSSHHSLDNKNSQPTRGRLQFSPCHSLRKLACHFPLLCCQSKKEKCWSSLLSPSLFSHKRGGCNSRALCLVKAQGPCLCTAPRYLFDSWGSQHWNETVALWWESFHIIVRSRCCGLTPTSN